MVGWKSTVSVQEGCLFSFYLGKCRSVYYCPQHKASILLDYQSHLTWKYLFSSLAHPLPSSPPPVFATRFIQKLLYCCLTEFDTETETQAGSKTQWATDDLHNFSSLLSAGGLALVHVLTFMFSSNAEKQDLSWTERRGTVSQRLWELPLPGQVKKRPDISNDSPGRSRPCGKLQTVAFFLKCDVLFYKDQWMSSMRI